MSSMLARELRFSLEPRRLNSYAVWLPQGEEVDSESGLIVSMDARNKQEVREMFPTALRIRKEN